MDQTGAPYTAAAFAADTGATGAQLDELHAFGNLLADWNGRMNLVGPSASSDFWRRHVLDSAQLLHLEPGARVWADVGSGAGLPGVVLAILLKGRPGAEVHLIESMAKRVGFLHAVVRALELPAVIHHARAEATPAPEALDIVTARACAPLPRLFGYTQQLFRSGARGLFLKGRDVASELTEARRSWTFDADLIPSRSDPSGRIVRIERLQPRA